MSPVVALQGTGMMGTAIGARLMAAGLRVVTSTEGRSAAARQRVADAGIDDLGSLAEVVRDADVVLSVMGSAEAPVAAAELLDALARQPDRRPLFVECNVLPPEDVVGLAARFAALGVDLVDAGIVGSPPTAGRTPTVHVSGPGLNRLAFLQEAGFVLHKLGGEVGRASALKLCSAAAVQGCVALVLEAFTAAERYGVAPDLLEDLQQGQAGFLDWIVPVALDAPARAARWAGDMPVIAHALEAVGTTGAHHRAAADLFASLSRLPDVLGARPTDLIAVARGLSAALPSPVRPVPVERASADGPSLALERP